MTTHLPVPRAERGAAAERGRGRLGGWPRTFSGRLLLAILGLIVASHLASGIFLIETINEDSLTKAQRDLQVGRRVLGNLMESRANDLLRSVRVLAADYGFKRAVATRDTATIASVLVNQGGRVGADAVLLASNAGELISSTVELPSGQAAFAFPDVLKQAQRRGEAAGVTVLDQRILQLVAVPVRAPAPVAWVLMGFLVDRELAAELKALTGLEVSFLGAGRAAEGADDEAMALSTTLPAETRPRVLAAWPQWAPRAGGQPFYALDSTYLTAILSVPGADAQSIAALHLPRARVESANRTLRLQFTGSLAVTLLLSTLLALWLSRGIARPLRALTRAAREIEGGHYGQSLPEPGSEELGTLASALDGMQRGIAERERQIRFHASHDALTGLPNRRFVEQRLAEKVSTGERFAVVVLCIDDFRAINDTVGYAIGDRVLVEVGRRLTQQFRAQTLVARIGGDEFLAVLDQIDAPAARSRVAGLMPTLAARIDIDGSPIALSLSLGLVAYPQHAQDVNRLLRRGEIALATAKERHGGIELYREGADETHQRELTLIRDLAGAIASGSLELAYQPKVDTADGTPRQLEALVRWTHPEYGQVPPTEFVFLAERSGMIRALTGAVLESALDQVAVWRGEGVQLVVSVNLSAWDLGDPALPDQIATMLGARGLAGRDLACEVTESALADDPETAADVLARLAGLGIELAVDDFGTGYSSLNQLRELPVHELKIDKSFVLHLPTRESDQLIVRSTIELAHNLNLSVVAEGVEDAEGWRLLEEWKCERLQGYFISRPMAPEAVTGWLQQWRMPRPSRPVKLYS